ncbi:MAG TPA: YhfC family glutamic-type intramembrane protease [Methanocella sp.]|nr:YhfC family glutamic-type intramembrane protease [Methanocella sp.]
MALRKSVSMVAWFNLLTGIGMIAVGLAAVFLWRRRAGFEYFWFGAMLWAVAIAIKLAMDFTVSPQLKGLVPASFLGVLALGLYYGLRTGIFESGIPYVAFRLAGKAPTFDQAVAVGIGAGAAEAIVLGLLSLLSVTAFILMPGLVSSYPPDTQATLQMQFSPAFVPVPIWERLFTLFCHVFAMALALLAVRAGPRWLLLSVAFMALLDGMLIPLLQYVTTRTYVDNLVIEAYVGAMGLVAIAGLFWLKKRYSAYVPQA